jgi:hypothetical protein
MSSQLAPRTATREQLDYALARRKTMSHLRLGDALVQERVITPEQRDEAIAMQAGDRRRLLGEILVQNGAATRQEVRRVLVEQLGIPCVSLTQFQFDPDAISAVSAELARKHLVMPLYRGGGRLSVAMESPPSWEALREIELSTGQRVDPVLAERDHLEAAITRFYGAPAEDRPAEGRPADPPPAMRVAAPAGDARESERMLVRLAHGMFDDAFEQGTFNFSFESIPDGSVRFRAEGVVTSRICPETP